MDDASAKLRLDGPLARQFRLRRVGVGPDLLVFCHGFCTGQSVWDHIVARMPGRYSALLFDFPGVSPERQVDFDLADCHSLAPFADDLLDLLDEAGVRRCSVIGHSCSGMIAALAAIENPDRFSRLVTLNSSPRYIDDATYTGGFTAPRLAELFHAMAEDFQAWAAGFAPRMIPAEAADAVTRFAVFLRAMRPDVAIAVARVIFGIDMRPLLASIAVPTVLIHSRADPAAPAPVAQYMQRHIPGSRLVWIESAGHLPHLSAPGEVADVIWAALA
jgi:sigma-B regulation protein RsbQ